MLSDEHDFYMTGIKIIKKAIRFIKGGCSMCIILYRLKVLWEEKKGKMTSNGRFAHCRWVSGPSGWT